MHLIDLVGLKPDVIASMRQVEIYYDSDSRLHEIFLDPSTQLVQGQGLSCFRSIAKKEMENRGDGLKPLSSRPLNLQEMLEKKVEEVTDETTLAPAPAFAPKVAGVAFGTMAKVQPKRASKRPNAPTHVESLDAPEPLPALEDGAQSESRFSETSKSKKGKADGLDEEMQQVASAHLATHSGSSVKSLQMLQPEKFLFQESDQKYAASSTLKGAGRYEKNRNPQTSKTS